MGYNIILVSGVPFGLQSNVDVCMQVSDEKEFIVGQWYDEHKMNFDKN